jgi:hypothetical protein
MHQKRYQWELVLFGDPNFLSMMGEAVGPARSMPQQRSNLKFRKCLADLKTKKII